MSNTKHTVLVLIEAPKTHVKINGLENIYNFKRLFIFFLTETLGYYK